MTGKYAYILLLLLSIGVPRPAAALELFGVALEATSRNELREAVRKAGLVLVREGGDDNWFDAYDSSAALTGSSRFYLGFVKRDQRFAFAEYEFRGLSAKRILRDLTIKYGAAEIRRGRYVSDRSYHWQRDGIDIQLSSDWQNYRTRLSYVNPVSMTDLLAERAAFSARQDTETEQVSLY